MLHSDPLEDHDLEEIEALTNIRNIPGRERHAVQRLRIGSQKLRPGDSPRRRPVYPSPELALQDDTEGSFNFSYHASRHEQVWIVDSLGGFYEGQWLDDVLRLIKGGKEAHVYQCLANGSVFGLEQSYIAAKVYRPRQFRNLKNDHQYREGRPDLDLDGGKLSQKLEVIQCAITHTRPFHQQVFRLGSQIPAHWV